MKKIITVLLMAMVCTTIFAQRKITELGTATSATTGSLLYIRQGATGDIVRHITIANLLSAYSTTVGTRSIVADSLNAYRANVEEGSTVFAMHAPDTVQHTANYTVGASDWTKDQHCRKTTSIVITLPTNLTEWTTGGIMNFYGLGAGIMVFKGGTIISDSDSIATSRIGQVVSVKKIAASKYILIGPLTD